jgi:hypothetical protein
MVVRVGDGESFGALASLGTEAHSRLPSVDVEQGTSTTHRYARDRLGLVSHIFLVGVQGGSTHSFDP